MLRKYQDTSNFHAVLDLPSIDLRGDWPDARSYFDTSQLRSPYKRGFYQDNQLRGLGVTQEIVTQPSTNWFLLGGSFLVGYIVARKLFDKP
jgi:hypothetical protein